MSSSPSDLQALLEAPDLAAFEQTTPALLKEWQRLATAATGEEPAATALTPETVHHNKRIYHIYGVIHGLTGGEDADYRQFLLEAISPLSHVVFENGLQHFYRTQQVTIIPDFVVLGWLGSLLLGLRVCLYLPALLLWAIRERIGGVPEQTWPTGRKYHGIDPELRRALDDQPALPTRLQIDLEMGRWNRQPLLAVIRDPILIVPRSLFMAGFLHGMRQDEVHCVVGDRHTTEVLFFLSTPQWHTHPLFLRGAADARRAWRYPVARIVHLLLAAVGSSLLVFPAAWFIATLVTGLLL